MYRPAIVLLLGKKRGTAASPNLRAPQAPSVRDELRSSAQIVGQPAAYRVQRRLLLLHDRLPFSRC